MRAEIKRIENSGIQWAVNVFLTKRERQELLKYLSMDTNEALKHFRNEKEVQLAKTAQEDFTVILTLYPYPDLNELFTPKDNCYAVIPVTHKDLEFITDSRIGGRERELLESNIMATIKMPNYYEITNKATKEIEYGALRIGVDNSRIKSV